MTIQLSPELEEMVRQDASSSGFSSVDEYVARIIRQQHDEDTSTAYRAEVSAKIDVGWDEAQRGQGIDGDLFWRELDDHKSRWRASRAG